MRSRRLSTGAVRSITALGVGAGTITGMELTGLTTASVHDRLRVEVGVDVLGGNLPSPRLVVFSQREAVLAVDARLRRQHEDWIEPILELLFLARLLRAGRFVLGWASRATTVGQGPPRFGLEVLELRPGWPLRRVQHHLHPFALAPEGMLAWEPRRRPVPAPAAVAFARIARRRSAPRGRHEIGAVTDLLREDGHRIVVAPALARRVARWSGARTAASP